MSRIRAVLLLATLILSGCTFTSAVMLESGITYPPTKDVQILTQNPSRPFKQIALLEAQGPAHTPIPQLLESMKRKAAAIGADAVVPMQQPPGPMYNPYTETVIRGVAIKYTGAGPSF